jgi:hypothetical protein
VVKYYDPGGSGTKITILVVEKKGTFYVGWVRQQLSKIGLPEEIGLNYVAQTAKLVGLKPQEDNPEWWQGFPDLSQLMPIYTEFMEEVEKFIKDIGQASESH